jgi:hypothetical protein
VGVTVVSKHRFYLAPISNRGEHCQAAQRAAADIEGHSAAATASRDD